MNSHNDENADTDISRTSTGNNSSLTALLFRVLGIPESAEIRRRLTEARDRELRVRDDLEKRLLEKHGEFWSVKQIAEYRGVDQRRIRTDIESGKLTRFKPPGESERGVKIHYIDLCDYIMKDRKQGRG